MSIPLPLFGKKSKCLYDFGRNGLRRQRMGSVQVTRGFQSQNLGSTSSTYGCYQAGWPIFVSQVVICSARCEISLRFWKNCLPQSTNRLRTGHESLSKPKLEFPEVTTEIIHRVKAEFCISAHYFPGKDAKFLYDFRRNAPYRQRIGTLQVTRACQSQNLSFSRSLYGYYLASRQILASQVICFHKRCKKLYDFERNSAQSQRIGTVQVTRKFQRQSLSFGRLL